MVPGGTVRGKPVDQGVRVVRRADAQPETYRRTR
jgi:hypothetical protein